MNEDEQINERTYHDHKRLHLMAVSQGSAIPNKPMGATRWII